MAVGGWRIEGWHGGVWIARRSGWGGAPSLPGWAEQIDPAEAAWRVDSWFPEGWGIGGREAASLAEIAAALGEAPLGEIDGDALPRLKEILREALRDGRLLAARPVLPPPGGGLLEAEDEAPPQPAARAAQETTWTEIVLVDDSDPPEPVPNVRYRVELPDGSLREGRLDAKGRARITGIAPGTCLVSFPDLDEREWRRLG